MSLPRLLLILIITTVIFSFFYFDGQQLLSFEALKKQQAVLNDYWHKQPIWTIAIYAASYLAVTGLSLPGATVLTLAGGALFGLWWGTLIVSFTSTLGATFAFLLARFLFKDSVEQHFGQHLNNFNAGIAKDGAFYLFSLRLVPLFPFFMINLLMGLTSIRVRTFYWVSQLGMLAGTFVYINAGTQLSKIESHRDILSPELLASFVALGLFPLLAKTMLNRISKYKVYKKWQKPKHFDNNLIVIGAGSGGLVTAYIAAAVKAKVTLIEKHKMGGDCLNTGCVPSKALIRSSHFLAQIKQADSLGMLHADVKFEFADIMQRVQEVIKTIEPHDSVERYHKLGVNVIQATAKIISPWQVQISNEQGVQTLTAKSIVIAAGARPFVPPIPGLADIDFLTSDNIWNLREKPQSLLVLGGGPIGCELAQAFARMQIRVVQVEMLPRIMTREDEEVSAAVTEKFKQEGIQVLTEHTAKQFIVDNNEKFLIAEHQGQEVRIGFDRVLIAIGRAANVSGYGVEEMGIELSPRQTIAVNPFMQTNYPNIYACGDVAGPYQFTHTAAHQAWYAAVNALFGTFKKFPVDYSVIPWATFTDPEVARVGLNEQDAKQQGVAYEVSRYDIDDLDRAIADNNAHGFVKVLTWPGKDKILGVTIVGTHAADLITEFVLAMKYNIGLNKILSTVHIYPTMSEANKYVAGVWKRGHKPEKLLQWLARYHSWIRH